MNIFNKSTKISLESIIILGVTEFYMYTDWK